MPITFPCPCGKTLRVPDAAAGKLVRCPACRDMARAPEAEPPPAFEVVEDEPPPPPRKRVADEPVTLELADEDDDRPRRRRPRDDDRDDDPPPPPRRKKKRAAKEEKADHFRMERGVMNGGVAGGVLAMIGAVVWFVVGLMNDILFYYPPVLFVLGLVGFFRGLAGGGRDD